jgi:hypothetical protein
VDRLRERVDPAKLTFAQSCSGIVDDLCQRVALRRGVGKWLADDHWPVDKLGVGRDDGYVGVIGSEISQGECGLQSRHSSAGDHDAELAGR